MPFDYSKIFTPLFKAAGIEMDSDRPYTDRVKKGESTSKSESTNEDELVDIDISASNTGNEEADEAIDKINEQLKTTKEQAEKQKKQYLQQIQSYQEQLQNYDKQIRQYSSTMYGGTGDSGQIANSIMQLSSERNKIYDNINLLFLNIQELEESLADAQKQAEEAINEIMEQLNSGAFDEFESTAASYNPNVGVTSTTSNIDNATSAANFSNTGSNVITNALKYDDKNESQMASIMKSAGSRYDPGLWCADFVSHVLKETYGQNGVPGDFLNTCSNTAYCPTILSWAQGNGSWSKSTDGVQAGDLVLFDWNGDGKPDHVGFYISNNGGGSVNTIEGNTSGAAGSSCVEAKKRSTSTILGYVKLSALS